MKKDLKLSIINIFLRYIFILLLGLKNIFIFYVLLTPLTIYPVYFILNIFYPVSLQGISLIINNYQIDLVEACIAGSAYYLLLTLNLLTPMEKKIRIYSLVYSFAVLLILNILRIGILSLLFINNSLFFDFTHKIFWYVMSTFFVLLIWFSEIRLFKIEGIPIYTDLKNIKEKIRRKK